ncbi:tyrosine-type recombinase/integrase [Sphingomonas abietis]|uniref:Tyrosine-type recombinase/integrase n=1 Tax=Sphingomonas abietis TaxID=3012344 RepID=A0ABY7NLX7_9SPHN|nr:tyrosine-type recombinase/integrase [Sphingomonas abietis]WBO22504.1 tyrosine-type recombinase/integrase [Sphingomonas abietis]
MSPAVERYLQYRRLLGYKDTDLWRDLTAFAKFANCRGASHLRNVDVLAWIDGKSVRSTQYEIASSLRRLGLFLHAEDNDHEVLDEEYVRSCQRPKRSIPYIYTYGEIKAVLGALRSYPLDHAYDAATYEHLIGLIAVTGLRLNEARTVSTSDFSGTEILIRRGKFGKDRIIYLHESTGNALRQYLHDRPLHLPREHLFVIHTGRMPSLSSIQTKFRKCVDDLHLPNRKGGGRPRIHDLRHTFATRSLAACGSDREVISNHILALSTYLGHVSITSTYWYLEISTETKEEMALAIEELLSA